MEISEAQLDELISAYYELKFFFGSTLKEAETCILTAAHKMGPVLRELAGTTAEEGDVRPRKKR